jgi:uncharacterized protein with von Willebrand factor type A (vWA) domain
MKLAENVLHFVRLLRAAGLPVGPAKALDALAAVEAVGLDHREDFRAALAAVLVSRREQLAIFDTAFELFWRNPRLAEKMMAQLLPSVQGRAEAPPAPPLPARLAQALYGTRPRPPVPDDPRDLDLDSTLTFSAREVLRHKDFASMTVDEEAQARAAMARLALPLPRLAMRRTRPSARGSRVDLRATMRAMCGPAGSCARLARREPRREAPPLVVLCDISGSMERYSRMLLHFLHALVNDRQRIHVLLFGTRLTNVTRHLRHRDADVALARVGDAAEDWSGGTRIGASIAEFNRRWSRRLLSRRAVVLLITDGLDADAGEGVETAMERLALSCKRLVWLNPLLRYEGFEPRAAGIRAMLPHVDDFLPVHDLHSLAGLAQALSTAPRRSARAAA